MIVGLWWATRPGGHGDFPVAGSLGHDFGALHGNLAPCRSPGSRFRKAALPDDRQGRVFASAPELGASWVAGRWPPHQWLELEADLIAAHVLATCRVPLAQFLG